MPVHIDNPFGDTGFDVEGTVKKLSDIERRPLKQIEKEIKTKQQQIQAWEEVKKLTKELEDKVRELYGFRSPFSQRQLESSDPKAVTGLVQNGTKPAMKKVEVLSLAANHEIKSAPYDYSQKLPAGQVTVIINGKKKSLSVPAGTTASGLETLLRDKWGGWVSVRVQSYGASKKTMTLESLVDGAQGRMSFEDPAGILSKIGILEEAEVASSVHELNFRSEQLKSFQPEKYPASPTAESTIHAGGLRLDLNGPISLRMPVPEGTLTPEGKIKFQFRLADAKSPQKPGPKNKKKDPANPAAEDDPQAKSVKSPVNDTITIGDIKLSGGFEQLFKPKQFPGQKNKKAQPDKKQPDAPPEGGIALGLVKKDGTVDFRKFTAAELADGQTRKLEWRMSEVKAEPAQIKSIVLLSTSPEKISFVRPLVLNPKQEKKDPEIYQVVTEASDARLRVDGVELEPQTKNKGLKNLIPGVTLDLLRETASPVDLVIKPSKNEAKKKIKEFVEAYNKLLEGARILSNPAEALAIGENRRRDQEGGILVGDSTLRRLIRSVRTATTRIYPGDIEPRFRVLAAIGISTGKPGSNWQDIKHGLLIVQEDKLDRALSENGLSVEELFMYDKNGDGSFEDGVAVEFLRVLKPYNQFVRGLITTRVNALKEDIKQSNKRYDKIEQYASKFEDRTRQKFRNMERAMQKSKKLQEYLKNNAPKR